MFHFYKSDFLSPRGCFGAGWVYAVGRAFQGTHILNQDLVPSIEEAMWHFMAFVQWMSLSEKQRRRQCFLQGPMMRMNKFFGATSVLSYEDHARIYGPTGRNLLWNTLPVPPVRTIVGCGYTNPVHILRYVFALGIPIDPFYVDKGDSHARNAKFTVKRNEKIYHLFQFAVCEEWHIKVRTAGSKHQVVFIAWVTSYRDAAMPGHSKQNRNSFIMISLMVAPPNERTNGTQNTFLVALGLKKNKEGWEAVEHQLEIVMSAVSDPKNPLDVYHGKPARCVGP